MDGDFPGVWHASLRHQRDLFDASAIFSKNVAIAPFNFWKMRSSSLLFETTTCSKSDSARVAASTIFEYFAPSGSSLIVARVFRIDAMKSEKRSDDIVPFPVPDEPSRSLVMKS